MEYHGDFPISYRSNITKGSSLSPQFLREGAMWPMNLSSIEIGESKTYPERPGEEDCSYYLRTGSCRYGMSCRFNHPIDRSLIMAEAHINGTYPERIGQPECQYYLKTGTCKFGATCKFHHPRDKAGVTGRVALNVLGYPLRQNEKECAYYLRTGQCKFGNTCKFHHPQPSSSVVSLGNSPVYTSVHSTTTTGQQSYPSDWSLSIPGSRWQGASNYARLILPQAMVPIPGWNAYTVTPSLPSGQMETISSSKSQQQNPSASQFRGTAPQINTTGYNSFSLGNYTLQRESTFPVRPGEPECQFYMKTGDCKFGAVCKFHHPKERIIPVPNCMLSPLGLPLRPGEPLCIFYSRYGICKFGPNCKFDHPMSAIEHTIPSPISSNVQVQQFLVSSSGFATLSLASNDTLESSNGKSRRISISETRQLASADENNEEER